MISGALATDAKENLARWEFQTTRVARLRSEMALEWFQNLQALRIRLDDNLDIGLGCGVPCGVKLFTAGREASRWKILAARWIESERATRWERKRVGRWIE